MRKAKRDMKLAFSKKNAKMSYKHTQQNNRIAIHRQPVLFFALRKRKKPPEGDSFVEAFAILDGLVHYLYQ